MRKLPLMLLCLQLLCVPARHLFPQNEELSVKGALIGGGEVLLSNGVVMLNNVIYTSLTGGLSAWVLPNASSIRHNLTRPWQ